MGKIHLYHDTKRSELRFLSPLDLELNSAIIDLFYILCIQIEDIERARPQRKFIYRMNYSLEIDILRFSNPFDIWGTLKNISKDTVQFALERTIFFQTELRKRNAEAKKIETETEDLQQNIIEKKLKNLSAIHELRKQFLADGIASDDAVRQIAVSLDDQRSSLSSDFPTERIFDRDL